jgi:hypothetical protein
MPGRRALSRWGLTAFGVIGASAIIGVAKFAAPHHHGAPAPAWIVTFTIAAALAIAWAIVCATLVFRRLDEFQRAASQFAWYWGGSIGIGLSLPIYVFVYLGGLHWLDPAHFRLGADLAFAFRLGYGLAAVSLLLGFLVALGVWRIIRQ